MDTLSAREVIFKRIRNAQNWSPQPGPVERDAVRDYLERYPAGPRPAVSFLDGSRRAHFEHQFVRVAGAVDNVATMAEVASAPAACLDGKGVPRDALACAKHGEVPGAVNFISVPSHNADIEQSIVSGTHCFYRMHLIIVHQA